MSKTHQQVHLYRYNLRVVLSQLAVLYAIGVYNLYDYYRDLLETPVVVKITLDPK